ncbi:MAG: hypothetical protein KIT84_34205 [Labilithrix sp.]|nr:hypothetical protein [Labilithrix sp.]MCW5816100.1 hypothetical protein [Labilithrix sp.]
MRTRSLGAFALLLLAACGGAEAGAPAKTAAPPPEEPASEPRTIEEAEEQIARLSSQLGVAGTGKSDATPGSGAEPAPPTADPKKAEKTDDRYYSLDSCASPCRALASMRRAVDALCRMTGDDDTRCVDAKKTLTNATLRTAPCKCT